MTIDEFVKKFDEIGWLAHLPDEKRTHLVRDLQEWHEKDPTLTYLGLATDIYDIEAIEDDDDYAELVRTYRHASNGVFDAREIESHLDPDNEEAFVAFTLRGRRYETRLSTELGDYVAEDFEPFLNRCLSEAGIEERFHTLPMVDQIARLAFVPQSVYDAAEAAGLLGVRPAPPPAPSRKAWSAWRFKGDRLPLPLPTATYVLACVAAIGLVALVGAVWGVPTALYEAVSVAALGALVVSLYFVEHTFGSHWLYQCSALAFTMVNAGLATAHVSRGGVLWLPVHLAVGATLIWAGASVGSGRPLDAQRYTRLIRRYCVSEGIEVPRSFGRHPAWRFVVVRTDSTPPRLSTATIFDEDDLDRYIRSKMRESGVSDASALPLRVLDFEAGQELAIDESGKARPAKPLVGWSGTPVKPLLP